VNDELHPAGVVEEPLDHEVLRRRQRAELRIACRKIGDHLLGDRAIDPGKSFDDLDGPLGACGGACPGGLGTEGGLDCAAQVGDGLGQLGGSRRRLTEPERDGR